MYNKPGPSWCHFFCSRSRKSTILSAKEIWYVWQLENCIEGRTTARVLESIDRIRQLWESIPGWFCHFFFVESMHKKLQTGCPMAGLMALDCFSLIPDLKESGYTGNAYEPIRFHREYGKSLDYFGRSKKTWTMKYPFIDAYDG